MNRFLLPLVLIFAWHSAQAREAAPTRAVPAPVTATSAQMDPEYWIGKLRKPGTIILDSRSIDAQNARLRREDSTYTDLEQLPSSISGDLVRAWVGRLSRLPQQPLWNEHGQPVGSADLAELADNAGLAAIPPAWSTRFGLVVARADLRTFPSLLRVFSRIGDVDIDRFQETALYPGTAAAIVHESRDRQWWFVVTALYAGWIEKSRIAEGRRQAVLDYGRTGPGIVVIGARAATVFTPELPETSELQLDMGVRLPLLTAVELVNGQDPSAAYVVQLPIRLADGSLRLAPTLLPRSAPVSETYLPLSEANLLRQAFKFLGERYGWGGSYNGRDCSAFVSDVFRSFGVDLPRNTGDQARSPALNWIQFSQASGGRVREAALRQLRVGDLLYLPGHVMMVIGFERGLPYVIHDTAGATHRDAGGGLSRRVLNGVTVTPLLPLLSDTGQPYVERLTSIVRIGAEPWRK